MSSSLAERNASASTKYTTSRSERLVDELKARRFRQIFTYLDQVRSYRLILQCQPVVPLNGPLGTAQQCKTLRLTAGGTRTCSCGAGCCSCQLC